MTIPFFEFRDFPLGITGQINAKVSEVISSKSYILGDEVSLFEKAFASFMGVDYCVAVGNGFDALRVSLMTLGIGEGDEVLINANSIPVTITAIVSVGAIPVLVDFNSTTGQLCLDLIEEAVSEKTKAVLPVHLYFQSCDMVRLKAFCELKQLKLIEDFAHCHQTVVAGQKLGTFGDISATSFYPTKILGALGDAGAIITNDKALYKKARSLRNYGKNTKGEYEFVGINSRMDDIHAGVLNVKLAHFGEIAKERKRIFNNYYNELSDVLLKRDFEDTVPHLCILKSDSIESIKNYLSENGIQTALHYAFNNTDKVWSHSKWSTSNLKTKVETNANTILSLPFYLGMTEEEQNYVIEHVLKATKQTKKY